MLKEGEVSQTKMLRNTISVANKMRCALEDCLHGNPHITDLQLQQWLLELNVDEMLRTLSPQKVVNESQSIEKTYVRAESKVKPESVETGRENKTQLAIPRKSS